jgi:hypothetical protein
MERRHRSRWSLWTVVGSVVVAVFLCGLFAAVAYAIQPQAQAKAAPTAIMMVIPAPTSTVTPETLLPTPTATNPPGSENGISVGAYVQITGTSGEGLRIRSGAGIDNPPRFLGMDSEVFKVADGPKHSDNLTWWYLVAPYDDTRSGWAAADYLSVVPNPNPETTPSPSPTP